jgi:hypothetical protein
MKKTLILLCMSVFALAANNAYAQKKYVKGDFLLNFGVGAQYYYAGGTPIIASGEFVLNDAFSIGPYLAFTSYGYNSGGNHWAYTFFDFGARASYHFSKHIPSLPDQLDLYGGAMLGFVASAYTDNNTVTGYDDAYPSVVRFGVVGGARWYFTEKFSVNGEVQGGGITPLMLGISFNL